MTSESVLGTGAAALPDPGGHCATADRVRELAPWLARRSAELEQQRRLPQDVVDALTDAGCLRMAVPARHGGDGLALPDVVTVIEELSRPSATIGWLVGQVALAHVVFAYLPEPPSDSIYAGGPDVYAAGAAAPKGRATRDGDGWRVSGRWPLVSGCEQAAWLYLQCLVVDADGGADGDAAVPPMVTVVVPAADVRILDTWRGMGLRGSGSNDVQAREVSCPSERSCDLTAEPPPVSPTMRVPAATQAGLVAAAVMTGTAAGAIDAAADLAAQKRPSFSSTRLAESTLFQHALGDATMKLAAARSLLHREVRRADGRLAAGAAAPGEDDPRLRAVAAKAAQLAAEAVDAAHRLGGSSAVVEGSPLERRLRDAHSLTQHATLSTDLLAPFGAQLVGAEPAVEVG